MTYIIETPIIGAQPIAVASTTQNHKLGTTVRAADPTYGEGEFIYLAGVTGTVVGTPVVYSNATVGYSTIAPIGTNIPDSIAFAMSTCVDGSFGWYQICGHALAIKATAALTAGTAVGIQTAGWINATATSKEVEGAVVTVTTTAADVYVQLLINRPRMQGRIT